MFTVAEKGFSHCWDGRDSMQAEARRSGLTSQPA